MRRARFPEKMLSVPVLGRTDSGSALSDTTTLTEARRFDATRGGHRVDRHGLTGAEHRAALNLAAAARDKAELRDFLEMCGLAPTAVTAAATS